MNASSTLHQLADFLCSRREEITAQWVDRVHSERRISSSEDLPRNELMDHLPKIFDHLTDRLRASDTNEAAAEVASDARAHGEHRWEQHFRLEELLREIGLLRTVFLRHLVGFQAAHPEFILETEWQAQRIVHDYFDGMSVDSTTQFVGKQQEEMTALNGSLEDARRMLEAQNDELLSRDERRLHMLRTISHEVRNHLNAVSVVVMILGKETNPAVCYEYLEMLSRNLQDITAMTNQLLDFATLLSGGERPQWEECEVTHLFDELSLFLQEMARTKGLRFLSSIDENLRVATLDRLKVRRIAMNLATNAIKYTPAGQVEMTFRIEDDDRWAIEVSDTGPGIAPEECARIFEEFHRVAATTGGQPGTGLGMAITQQLTHLLGGEIQIESEVGKGTRFRVFLPRKCPGPKSGSGGNLP